MKINYFNNTDIRLPKSKIIKIAETLFEKENADLNGIVNVIFVDDEFITKMNNEFLSHNYATDVISFVIDDEPFLGEIYISVETAKNQANDYKVSLTNELLRLTIHGALHLCGYDDATDELRKEMQILEDKYLKLI